MARRSDEAEAWFTLVYTAIQEVPRGRVTSYGHIARLVGHPERSRQVGVCLKHLPDDIAMRFNSSTVPWQRIINAKGCISPRGDRGAGASRQAAALRREGVQVARGAMGELVVDLSTYGWFPDMLPSDAAEADESESDDNESDEKSDHDGS